MKKRKLILRPDGSYDVPLTRGLFAIIDPEDREIVERYNWFAWKRRDGVFAAATWILIEGKPIQVRLHTLLIYGPVRINRSNQVDHKDHNTLDNRRNNLRPATNGPNSVNRRGWGSSGFKGVFKAKNRFRSRITHNGTIHDLGYFTNPVEAARAYDVAALIHHGEFAKLNFPSEGQA